MENCRFHVLVASRQDFCFIFQKMNELEGFAVWFLPKRTNRKKKFKQKREFWIHPIDTLDDREGAFHTLFHRHENFPTKFFNYFRMSVSLYRTRHSP